MNHIRTFTPDDVADSFESTKGWQNLSKTDLEALTDLVLEICVNTRLNPQDVQFEWLAYSAKNQLSLSLKEIESFKIYIEKRVASQQNKENRKPKTTRRAIVKRKNTNQPFDLLKTESTNILTSPKILKPQPLTPKAEKFNKRDNSGQVFVHYGECEIPDFKFQEKASFQIENFEDKGFTKNMSHLPIDFEKRLACGKYEYTSISSSHNDNSWSIGFVQKNFTEDRETKFGLDNAILCDAMGNWARLDFGRCEPVSIFPGQILRVYGRNPTGSLIHVDKAEWETAENCNTGNETEENFTLGVIAGPFTFNWASLKNNSFSKHFGRFNFLNLPLMITSSSVHS